MKIYTPNALRAVTILAKAKLDSADREFIHSLDSLELTETIELAKVNQTLVLLSQYACDLFPKLYEKLSPQDLHFIEKITNTNNARTQKTYELLKEFERNNLKLILLKGSLFSQLVYKNTNYKKMNDLDLLIHRSEQRSGEKILNALDYTCIGDLFGTMDMGGDSHHTPPYVSEDLKCVTGLHFALNSKHSPFKINSEEMFDDIKEIQIEGIKAYHLSVEDNIIHLCVHLPYYKIGLRELADLSNLILKYNEEIDWTKLLNKINNQQLHDPLYRVLSLAKSLINFSIPDEFLEELKNQSSALTVSDTHMRMRDNNLLLQSRSTHLAKIEKYFVIFKITENAKEKVLSLLKMWQLWLYPPTNEIQKIIGTTKELSFKRLLMLRIVTPMRIWLAMARDHGQLPLVIVTLHNAYTGLKTLIKLPFTKKKPGLKEHKFYPLLKALE